MQLWAFPHNHLLQIAHRSPALMNSTTGLNYMFTKTLAFFLTTLLALGTVNSSIADGKTKVKTKSNIKNDRMTTTNADSNLGRVKIKVWLDVDRSAAVTMTTDESGCATFSELPSGEYKVMVSDFTKHLVLRNTADLNLCLIANGDGADLVMNEKNYVGHVTLMKQ
jgi:hypothetical protein